MISPTPAVARLVRPAAAPTVRRGFTLLELMVVMVIGSLMLGLAWSSYHSHMLATNRKQAAQALLLTYKATRNYARDKRAPSDLMIDTVAMKVWGARASDGATIADTVDLKLLFGVTRLHFSPDSTTMIRFDLYGRQYSPTAFTALAAHVTSADSNMIYMIPSSYVDIR